MLLWHVQQVRLPGLRVAPYSQARGSLALLCEKIGHRMHMPSAHAFWVSAFVLSEVDSPLR